MSELSVEIYYSCRNWLAVYINRTDEDGFMQICNALNNLPVISYSKKDRCNYVSLYYYKELIDALNRKNINAIVDKRVPILYNRLCKKVSHKHSEKDIPTSLMWSDNKDYSILPYQKLAVSYGVNRLKYIIGDDMGIGKSCEAIGIMLHAFEQGYKRALVVCLNSNKYQWKYEILKFTKFKEEDILIISEGKPSCRTGQVVKFTLKNKVCQFCKFCDACTALKGSKDKFRRHQFLKEKDKRIVIMNYELASKHVEQIKNGDFDIYILDEATKIKNYSTAMSRSFRKIGGNFKADDIFIAMSGTIIENKIQEFYPVFSMIDDAVFGTWSNFKNRYLVCDHFGKVLGIQNEEALKDIVKKFMIRRTVDQVWHDRPELMEINRFCEMPNAQARIYNQISTGKAEELIGDYNKKVNMAQAVAVMSYLIMVADTAESVADLGKNKPEDFSCKIAMLKDMIKDEIDGKIVIFSKFAKKVIPIIRRELDAIKVGNCTITGETSIKDRYSICGEFEKSSTKRVLICSDAMSYGSNMQFAKCVVNFDLPWNPAILDQRIRRLYRKGQKNDVTVINLIAKDTVENYVLDKIYAKREMFKKFIGAGIEPKQLSGIINVENMIKFIRAGA